MWGRVDIMVKKLIKEEKKVKGKKRMENTDMNQSCQLTENPRKVIISFTGAPFTRA